MSDEPRKPDQPQEPTGEEPGAPPGDEPKPATWAGRQRAQGSEAEADQPESAEPDEPEADQPEPAEPEEQEADQPVSDEPEEPEADQPEPAADPRETTEADTLTVADREAAQEAAHAGLRARAAGEATSAPPPRAAVPRPPATVVAAANGSGAGDPPKRTMWWRFAAASAVIITAMATATAVSFLLFLSGIAKGLDDDDALESVKGELASVEGGDPQTILILGSDKRGGTPGDPGRSDTALLLRVDADKGLLSLLSLPRDLKVEIPGYGTDRLNAAYSYGEQSRAPGGGPKLAVETIKGLLGIDINHIVNIDFEGFYDVVNAIDCVYVDVDRHYFNSNEGLYGDQLYAVIDVPAGYSKLCGYKALQYVRYRHLDNDIVRGARQQDFLREARQRIPPRDLLPFIPGSDGDKLIEIFEKHTTSDIDSITTILDMLETFVAVRGVSVRQVELESTLEASYVVATQEQIDAAVEQFLGEDLEEQSADPAPAPDPDKPKKKDDEPKPPEEPAFIDAAAAGQQQAASFARELEKRDTNLPVFYPTKLAPNLDTAITDDSRVFALAGPDNEEVFQGYKFVISYQEEGFVSYYGLSGVTWTDPPILENPSEVREIDGREYLLFFDRDRLRLVGWKTSKGAFWVINTLTQSLSEQEMLGIATSARELGD